MTTVVVVREDRAEDLGVLRVDTLCAAHPLSAVDQIAAAELLALLPGSPDWPEPKDGPKSAKYLRGAARVLAWLQQFGGGGWQARWDTANGNDTEWIDQLVEQDWHSTASSRDELLAGLRFLMLARAFRPSYEFFHSYRPVRFYDCAQRTLGSDLFAGLDQTGAELGMPRKHVNDAKKTLVKIMLHTGESLDTIDEVDFFRTAGSLPGSESARTARHLPSLGSTPGDRRTLRDAVTSSGCSPAGPTAHLGAGGLVPASLPACP